MDEVTLVDLDLGTCEPSPGSPRDDARLLPWSDRLQAALQVTSLHFTTCALFRQQYRQWKEAVIEQHRRAFASADVLFSFELVTLFFFVSHVCVEGSKGL